MRHFAHEFKEAAAKRGITRWDIHTCGMCGYKCGYLIIGDFVTYDAGCRCTGGSDQVERTWDTIADFYNRNAGASDAENRSKENTRFRDYVFETNEFWGFEQPGWMKKHKNVDEPVKNV